MLYTFKKNGIRAAVHTRSGKTHILDSLTFDMLAQFADETTLPEELPMGTRYFFAKYDSGDLKRSYATVREIHKCEAEDMADPTERPVSGAVLSPAPLGDRYETILRSLPCDASLLLVVGEGENVDEIFAKTRSILPEAKITLRAPLDLCHGADAFQVVVGNIASFTGADLPENATVYATFTADTDLSKEVTRLLDAGYAVCAVPDATMDPDATVQAYDALSRTLTRRKRTDKNFQFLPFAVQETSGGWMLEEAVVTTDLDTLPGGFWQYGAQMHIAGDISSPAILRSLVESAIVLAQA